MRARWVSWMSVWVGVVAVAAVAASAAGDRNTGFGSGGAVTSAIGNWPYASASALVLQPDGKLVAAGDGYAGERSGAFALVRYDETGQLDPSFGSGGTVTTAIGKRAGARALVLQPDGKLIAAGYGGTFANRKFALVRYDTNGRLDRSFGNGGIVTTAMGGFAGAQALVLQADGKLVAAGYGSTDRFLPGTTFALARYDKNGRLDRSFGNGGTVSTEIGSGDDAEALLLQADGKLVAAGYDSEASSFLALARFETSGRLDRSFGNSGTVTARRRLGWAEALVLQPDGKLVAAGDDSPNNDRSSRFALFRFDKNGRLDRSFGNGGTVTTAIGKLASATALVLQPDRKLVAAGYGGTRTSGKFALVRYNKNGRPDRSFGNGGTVTTTIGTTPASPHWYSSRTESSSPPATATASSRSSVTTVLDASTSNDGRPGPPETTARSTRRRRSGYISNARAGDRPHSSIHSIRRVCTERRVARLGLHSTPRVLPSSDGHEADGLGRGTSS